MYGLVAVEKNLSNIVDLLEAQGYDVVAIDEADLAEVDAIVISGADANLMNIQDVAAEVPVINAAGKTSDEILQELNRI
ncbi:MAG: YkuS family protein [Negativicutes bacterium]|nr:YkuS family protein [Negativicutes bacterium]